FITLFDIRLFRAGSQHDDRNKTSLFITFDNAQYFQSSDFGHLQVQHDQGRIALCPISELTLSCNVVQRLLAILDPGDIVDESNALECAHRHLRICCRILGKQNMGGQHVLHALVSSSLGMLKLNTVSRPGSLCAHMRPPCRTTTRLTMARPTPVPE